MEKFRKNLIIKKKIHHYRKNHKDYIVIAVLGAWIDTENPCEVKIQYAHDE